jgi:hypothetical protein
MSYSDLKLSVALERFELTLAEEIGTFGRVAPVEPGALLAQLLYEQVPLAVAINTEKARSELIIANVLMEVRRHFEKRISIFSGVELSIDPEQDLSGYCDFLVSLAPEQLLVRAPIITLVEAKRGNLTEALGQCFGEMVAAQRFNQNQGKPLKRIYGVVTSGTDWMFAALEDKTVVSDLTEYNIEEPERILGTLCAMVEQRI